MDREALVIRNQSMAAAIHATPIKHYIRRTLLALLAEIPILPARQTSIERILLIRPDHLGDVLLSTPAIRALRAALPHAEIHALVGPWSARVLAHYPEIDAVLTLPFPGFSRDVKESWRSPYEIALTTARHLRRIVYSSAVVLRPDHWWGAMVSHLASIPERIGYNLPDTAPYLTRALQHQHEHAVVQSLRLIEAWTGPLDPANAIYKFPIDDPDRSYVESYLEEWGIPPDKPVFCIHPGSGAWTKNWPDEQWTSVADILAGQLDASVVFTGGEHETAMVKRIVQEMKQPYCVITGETHIGQLAALYARAQVVLGPDSGPLHLAAAVGTPTVSLFGPADPAEFGPWGSPQRHIVLTSDIGCRPCRVLDWADDNPLFHPCVRDIGVGQVLEAARRVVQAADM